MTLREQRMSAEFQKNIKEFFKNKQFSPLEQEMLDDLTLLHDLYNRNFERLTKSRRMGLDHRHRVHIEIEKAMNSICIWYKNLLGIRVQDPGEEYNPTEADLFKQGLPPRVSNGEIV